MLRNPLFVMSVAMLTSIRRPSIAIWKHTMSVKTEPRRRSHFHCQTFLKRKRFWYFPRTMMTKCEVLSRYFRESCSEMDLDVSVVYKSKQFSTFLIWSHAWDGIEPCFPYCIRVDLMHDLRSVEHSKEIFPLKELLHSSFSTCYNSIFLQKDNFHTQHSSQRVKTFFSSKWICGYNKQTTSNRQSVKSAER